jgi:hypothetical protein
MSKNYIYIISLLCALSASHQAQAYEVVSSEAICPSREMCEQRNNGLCKCYCAYERNAREWKEDDEGIFVENDPRGHYCYCKQRDLDKARRDEPLND